MTCSGPPNFGCSIKTHKNGLDDQGHKACEWAAEILDLLPDLILEADQDLIIQRTNQTALRWLGASVIGRSVLDLAASPEDRDRIQEAAMSCVQESDLHIRVSITISNGSERHFDLSGRWRRGPRARSPVLLLVLRDITDREKQNRELEKITELLSTLVNNVPDLVCVKDGEGRWQMANPAALKLLHLEDIDYQGKTDLDLTAQVPFFRKVLQTCFQTDQQAWQKGGLTRSIETIDQPDASSKIYDVIKVPLYHKDGSRRALVVVGRDITLLKEVERSRIILSEYLRAVSQISTLLLQSNQVDKVAAEVLEILGKAAGASRCYWFEAHEHQGGECISLRAEWSVNGNVSETRSSELRNIPWNMGLERWQRVLESDEPIQGVVTDFLPEERGLFLQEGARAVLLLPLKVQGRLAGFIGFESRRQKPMWSQEEVDLLKAGVLNFALALEKEETHRFLEFHKQVLEASPDHIAVVDSDWCYILANKSYRDSIGRGAASMIGRHALEFFDEKDFREIVEPLISKVVESKEPVTFNAWFNLPGQGDRLMTRSYFPLLDKDGNLQAVGVIGRDVTELEKTREEIGKREREIMRLYAAVEQLPVSVVMTDINGDIQYVNAAFERTTGYSREEALGQNPRILKSGKHEDAFYKEMWETISSGEVWQGRFINKARDGHLFTEEAVISPVKGEDGSIIGYIAVKEDITQRLALEAELRQAQKLEAVGTLAGGLAHDFNNILAALQGYITLLKQNPLIRQEGGHILNKLERAVERGAGLTRKVLAISKPTEAAMAPLDVNEVIREAVSVLQETTDRRISFHLDLDETIPPVKGDHGQLIQVMMNLLVNAIQAMPQGGDIIVRTSVQWGEVLIEVCDTGLGMDQEILGKVFDPFFTTKSPGKGTGLGLTMVHRIVESHQGHITVQSVKGEGTTFYISLPAMDGKAMTDKEWNSATGREPEENSSRSGGQGGFRLLVVDDEPMLREILKDGLESMGYFVEAADTGMEALRILQQDPGRFDLVILDMNMPGWDGLDTLNRLREVRQDLPAVLATGYAEDQRLKAFEGAGMVNVVHKPFKLDQLEGAVRSLLKP